MYRTNYKKQQEVPFIIYADFKSILEKFDGDEKCKSAYQKHIPISYCWYVKSSDKTWNHEATIYTSLDCLECFMHDMDLLNDEIRTVFGKEVKMIPLTDDERLQYESVTTCYACHKRLFTGNDKSSKV